MISIQVILTVVCLVATVRLVLLLPEAFTCYGRLLGGLVSGMAVALAVYTLLCFVATCALISIL